MKLVFALFGCATAVLALDVMPGAVTLQGKEGRQQLLAHARAGGFDQDLTRTVEWKSSNPAIVAIGGNGVAEAKGDGDAVITASGNGQIATVKVHVSGAGQPWQWSFRNQVVPVLTKQGCNQGACHGALAGKNGFKLTLRGYDPELDYDMLTRQSVGRRVSLAEPEQSLMVLKPSMKMPHGGGLRLKPGTLEYRVITEWIAAGAPAPLAKEREVVGLEVFPKQSILKPASEQQLVVKAKYSDGTTADVTRWVKYGSANEGVATVDDNGLVKVNGSGEAAITLWYQSNVLYSTITSPYPNQVAPEIYSNWKRNNFVDERVIAKLQGLNIQPSKDADDATFIRRAYVDAAGVLPSAEEVEQFLADKRADKRARMIDSLLERDEFVDYWAYKWSDLMLVSSRKLRQPSMWAFYSWIRDGVKADKPWDQFARDIFTGTGSTKDNGALNYFVLHKDVSDLTENVTQAFLGQRLTCARCHNHPLEKWTQKQYFQFANLFSRVGLKSGDDGFDVVFAKTSGGINHPRLLRPLDPTPLDGKSMPLDDASDRRVHFANWLTSPSNQYFSRNIVNRVWGSFMGRGLSHPVDDVRATNPASNEELFAALVGDFVTNKYSIKHLIRTIMNSHAYQLSAEANATNQNDNIFYSKYIVKRLPAEVLLDAFSQVTGVPTAFDGYPAGTRALQLPDTQVKSQFLTVFGRPPRVLCDAAERSADATIGQALHVINGDTLNRKLSSSDGNISSFLKLGLSDARILEFMTLSAFSRYPTEDEKSKLATVLAQARQTSGTPEAQKESRRQAIEDMSWALLTSKEFMFTH